MTVDPQKSRGANPIIVVSGLPRSGTSLMMQILSAARVPIMADEHRPADSHNPSGYFEYEPVKRILRDSSWLPDACGKAIKIVAPLSAHLPPNLDYRVLLMERSIEEIVRSQEKMILSLGKRPSAPLRMMAKTLEQQQQISLAKLSKNPAVRMHRVRFLDLFECPMMTLEHIFEFLELPRIKLEELLPVIDRQLYRTRRSFTPVSRELMDELPKQQNPVPPVRDNSICGIVVVSVPKSGTNLLSHNLAKITGWRHRWGRPSRDVVQLSEELPTEPDPEIYRRAVHLIATDKDLKWKSPSDRPMLFGERKLIKIDDSRAALEHHRAREQQLVRNIVMAEHPFRSLAFWLRNPADVPLLEPQEVLDEARLRGYGVVFLHRDFRDVVNSLAHFLLAGTRYVQFSTWEDSMDLVLRHYAPVLARATRLWLSQFEGQKLTYESLTKNPNPTMQQLLHDFGLPCDVSRINDSLEHRAFTFRKGGSQDWKNHLSLAQSQLLEQEYPDLLHLNAEDTETELDRPN
jgi:hypothetical protein